MTAPDWGPAIAAAIAPIKARSIALLGVRPGHRVLDAGCGSGRDAETLLDLVGIDGQVTGTDPNPTAIANALGRTEAKRDRLKFKVADSYDLPFHASSFDTARMDRVLQTLHEPAAAVAQLAWVVRAGGRIVLMEPDWESLTVGGADPRVTRIVVSHIADTSQPSGKVGRDLAMLLSDAGCHAIEVELHSLVMRNLGAMDHLASLGAALADLVAAGRLANDAAEAWWQRLEDHDAEKCFWGGMTVTIAVATVSG